MFRENALFEFRGPFGFPKKYKYTLVSTPFGSFWGAYFDVLLGVVFGVVFCVLVIGMRVLNNFGSLWGALGVQRAPTVSPKSLQNGYSSSDPTLGSILSAFWEDLEGDGH